MRRGECYYIVVCPAQGIAVGRGQVRAGQVITQVSCGPDTGMPTARPGIHGTIIYSSPGTRPSQARVRTE